MSLPDIVKRIQEEANLESERYMTDARVQIAKMKEASTRELKATMDDMEIKLAKEKRALWNMYISEGRRRSRNVILSAKEELIWETMSALRNRLRGIEGEELARRLVPLLDAANKVLGRNMTIYPVRGMDASALTGRGTVGTTIVGASELPPLLRRFHGRDLIGGFISVSLDGARVMDMTFQGILEKNEESIREVISRTLFEE
ncbi:MAG: V-type ATP synthase subunit E [Candidatus Thermoplasmatota archaeon]|nr:V-type ATP synthase subunit E [Candidatus Thermoplasmatota archaeon]